MLDDLIGDVVDMLPAYEQKCEETNEIRSAIVQPNKLLLDTYLCK